MKKGTLISTLPHMRYKSEQIIGDHVAVLQSQFTLLGSMKREFDGSTKLAITILTLKHCNKFEPLLVSVKVAKEINHSWWQVSSLFIEEFKRLDDKMANKGHENGSDLGCLAGMSGNV